MDNINNKENPDKQFESMIEIFYSHEPYLKNLNINRELEVRFGTKGNQRIYKIDYDNVVKKLKSLGFHSNNEEGEYLLRINTEYYNDKFGYILSNIRSEITGLDAIQYYCKTNDINKLIESTQPYYSVNLNKKSNATITKYEIKEKETKINIVNYNDYNFRVSYQTEEMINKTNNIAKGIFDKWIQTKKSFRYINRVSFKKDDLPISVDLSIVKSSSIDKKGKYLLFTNIDESNVFNNSEFYEIELEIINSEIGPGTNFNTPKDILYALKKTIFIVLAGIQNTNYPISYSEQNNILNDYFKLFIKENTIPYNILKQKSQYFIGPSSYTLQLKNIIPINENMKIPNIRRNYCVTDKADGERGLMYISREGKIFIINNNMNILFTGAITKEKTIFNSLIDGEIILHDKNNKFINLFVAFDIYYMNGNDVRNLMFIETLNKNMDTNPKNVYRYSLLINLIKNINPISFVEGNNVSPIRIQYKNFYSTIDEDDESIFKACNAILSDIYNNNYEYNTDGLIFTPCQYGVASNKIGVAGNVKKITWEYSFKWKPPEFNTIDFLVSTEKDTNNIEPIKSIFQDGINATFLEQIIQYKTLILRCGFDEKKHGFINPCQDIIDDKLPSFIEDKSYEYNDNYKPVQFYPSNPYDLNAGICNIILKKDKNDKLQMFTEENEIIEDNTIVEFKYDLNNKDNFNWIPLRVRYDKTNELKRGKKNFGNDYKVADSNWYSIHNPITFEMISTGNNIPKNIIDSDIYYNKSVSDTNTQGLRDFHNLFVKKRLISSVSKPKQTLIDYSCGKGGDFPKWIDSKLSFVFGIDISKDNIENRLNGACSRFLNYKKEFKDVPYALFVNGNSSLNIKNGDAMFDEKSKQITQIIFGNHNINEDIVGKGVLREKGIGKLGFNISSCQFSIHYFFENDNKLFNFIRNISECTALGGYFIGTSYDGNHIFERLKKLKMNETETIYDDNGEKVWQIVKKYNSSVFNDDETCIGYKIGVYQESINNIFDEYLVNYNYLTRILENYGFVLLSNDQAKQLGMPSSTDMFNVLYNLMINTQQQTQKLKLGEALNLKHYEKEISFLNRYFIYKKIRDVDSEKITKQFLDKTFSSNELNEYISSQENYIIKKPIKINKKIIIIPEINFDESEEKKTLPLPELKTIEPTIIPDKKITTLRKYKKRVKIISEPQLIEEPKPQLIEESKPQPIEEPKPQPIEEIQIEPSNKLKERSTKSIKKTKEPKERKMKKIKNPTNEARKKNRIIVEDDGINSP